MPKFTLDVRADFTHLQVFQGRSLGCVGNIAHSSTLTYLFETAFHSPHQLWPQGHHHNQKNTSYSMVCSGQETVRWLQSYALKGLFGRVCLRKGWPSGGDDLTKAHDSPTPAHFHLLQCVHINARVSGKHDLALYMIGNDIFISFPANISPTLGGYW